MADLERHALIYDDLRVEVVLDTDGNVSVDFTSDGGEEVTSFSWAEWNRLVVFAARAAQMTESDALATDAEITEIATAFVGKS